MEGDIAVSAAHEDVFEESVVLRHGSSSTRWATPPRRSRRGDVPEGSPSPGRYSVQVGSFTAESNAQALKAELGQKVVSVHLVKALIGGEAYYRVRVGQFASRAETQRAAERLASLGYRVLIMGPEDRP